MRKSCPKINYIQDMLRRSIKDSLWMTVIKILMSLEKIKEGSGQYLKEGHIIVLLKMSNKIQHSFNS